MTKTAVARILTAAPALLALVPGAARAHEIDRLHVHETHIAQGIHQGLGLAALVAVVLGVAFLVARRRRR